MNAFPGIGWAISLGLNASLAVPFWVFWTWWGIGERYAYWLPKVFQAPDIIDCIGVFIILEILASVIPTPFRVKLSGVVNIKE